MAEWDPLKGEPANPTAGLPEDTRLWSKSSSFRAKHPRRAAHIAAGSLHDHAESEDRFGQQETSLLEDGTGEHRPIGREEPIEGRGGRGSLRAESTSYREQSESGERYHDAREGESSVKAKPRQLRPPSASRSSSRRHTVTAASSVKPTGKGTTREEQRKRDTSITRTRGYSDGNLTAAQVPPQALTTSEGTSTRRKGDPPAGEQQLRTLGSQGGRAQSTKPAEGGRQSGEGTSTQKERDPPAGEQQLRPLGSQGERAQSGELAEGKREHQHSVEAGELPQSGDATGDNRRNPPTPGQLDRHYLDRQASGGPRDRLLAADGAPTATGNKTDGHLGRYLSATGQQDRAGQEPQIGRGQEGRIASGGGRTSGLRQQTATHVGHNLPTDRGPAAAPLATPQGTREVRVSRPVMAGREAGLLGGMIKAEKYDGKRNPDKADTWLNRMKLLIGDRMATTDDDSRIWFMQLHLEGKASHWCKKKKKDRVIMDMASFEVQFRKEFIEPKPEDEIALDAVSQHDRESVSDYADRVEALTSHMQVIRPPVPGTTGLEYDIRTRPFLNGLRDLSLKLIVTAQAANATMEVARLAAEHEEARTKAQLCASARAAIERGQRTIYLEDTGKENQRGKFQSGGRSTQEPTEQREDNGGGDDRYQENNWRGRGRIRKRYTNRGGYGGGGEEHNDQTGSGNFRQAGEDQNGGRTFPVGKASYQRKATTDNFDGAQGGNTYQRTYSNAGEGLTPRAQSRPADTPRSEPTWQASQSAGSSPRGGSTYRGRGRGGGPRGGYGGGNDYRGQGGRGGGYERGGGYGGRGGARGAYQGGDRKPSGERGNTSIGATPASTLGNSAPRGEANGSSNPKAWTPMSQDEGRDRARHVREEVPDTTSSSFPSRTGRPTEVLTSRERMRTTGPDPLTGDMEALLGKELQTKTAAAMDSGTTKTLGCDTHKRQLQQSGEDVEIERISPPLRFYLADPKIWVECKEAIWSDLALRCTSTKMLCLRRLKIYLVPGNRIPTILIGKEVQAKLGIEPSMAAVTLCVHGGIQQGIALPRPQLVRRCIQEEEEEATLGRRQRQEPSCERENTA
eukprot:GHVU01062883.1.p1 GENE.GHVU01062883.1~~GHVU01062883.1.p1  ORF type:complete len:1078 (-),score=171.49 GHVU01062883.1:26-3259(-)